MYGLSNSGDRFYMMTLSDLQGYPVYHLLQNFYEYNFS